MSIEAMTRVWMFAPHDGKALTVLLALADHANGSSVCWPSVASLMLYSRVRHERNFRQYVRQLEATGDLYCRSGNGRANRSRYLVATALSEEELIEILVDREHFNMERQQASVLARELVDRQSRAQVDYEKVVPLNELRARRRFGASSRQEKKRISESSSSLKEGSDDLGEGDQVIRQKKDRLIQRKTGSEALQTAKTASEPPASDPTYANPHESPPVGNRRGGGGDLTPTGRFLLNELHTNVSVAHELGDLPLDAIKQLVTQKRARGAQTGAIVQILRATREQLMEAAQAANTSSIGSQATCSDYHQRAHAIAPQADGLDLQYILLDLEDGLSDQEAYECYKRRSGGVL